MEMRFPRPFLRGAHATSCGLLFAVLAAACSGTPTAPTPTPAISGQQVAPPDARPALSVTCPVVPAVTTANTPVAVTFASATAAGGVSPVQVSCTRESGSMFSAGTTSVQCTAADAAGQSAACVFNVTVSVTSPRLSRTRLLAFGDSLTVGEVSVPASSQMGQRGPNFRLIVVPSAAYPIQLSTLLRNRYTAQASSIGVINSGLPGEWAQDAERRLPGVLANARPDVVLLLDGYNDISAQLDLGVIRATNSIDRMAKEARGRGARVILATLPPPRPGGPRTVPTKLITDLNGWIRSIASGEGAVLVDLYGGMLSDVTRYIGPDGLHPTEAGYRRIAELFFEAIRTDLEVR